MEIEPKRRVKTCNHPDEFWEEVVRQIEDGEFVAVACKNAGCSISGLYTASDRIPGLRDRLKAANRAKATESAEAARAMANELAGYWRQGDPRAEQSAAVGVCIKSAQWDAERRCPDEWGAKQSIEHSGGMTLSAGPPMAALTQAQLEALAAIEDAEEKKI